MKKLCSLKSALLMGAVALSVLSSPLGAVSKNVVKKYWQANSEDGQELDAHVLKRLADLTDEQWKQFVTTAQSLMTDDMDG